MESSVTTGFLVGVSVGICLGLLLSSNNARKLPLIGSLIRKYAPLHVGPKQSKERPDSSSDSPIALNDWGEYKMVLVVRTDLGMGKGKAAAQCCHAAVEVYNRTKQRHPKWLEEWESSECPKVVLKASDEETLLELAKEARKMNLDCVLISDAGRTQIAPGSRTVLGIGPAPVELMDKVTGHLKLY